MTKSWLRIGKVTMMLTIAALFLVACGGDDKPAESTPIPTATVATVPATPTEPTESIPAETVQSEAPGSDAATDLTIPIEVYAGDIDAVDALSFDVDGNGSFNAEEFRNILSEIYPLYVWPPDFFISLETAISHISETINEPTLGVVAVNYAMEDYRGAIDTRHHCAWIMQWARFHETGRDELAAATLDALDVITDQMAMAEYDKGRFHGWLDQARLGDYSMLMLFVESPGMCGGHTWDERPDEAAGVITPGVSEVARW